MASKVKDAVQSALDYVRNNIISAIPHSTVVAAEKQHSARMGNISKYIRIAADCKCKFLSSMKQTLPQTRQSKVLLEILSLLMKKKFDNRKLKTNIDQAIQLHSNLVKDEAALKQFFDKCECKQPTSGQDAVLQTEGNKPQDGGHIEVQGRGFADPKKKNGAQKKETDKQKKSAGNSVGTAASKPADQHEQQVSGRKKRITSAVGSRRAREPEGNEDLKRENEILKSELNEYKESMQNEYVPRQDYVKISEENKRLRDDLTASQENPGVDQLAFERLQKKYEDYKELLRRKNNEVDELKTRLSEMTANKLRENNPAIADLSDINRPTNLAEYFKQVYDDEWTHAYEDLEVQTKDEAIVIDLLAGIVKEVKNLCVSAREQLADNLVSHVQSVMMNPFEPKVPPRKKKSDTAQEKNGGSKYTKVISKEMAGLTIPYLVERFKNSSLKTLLKRSSVKKIPDSVNIFVDKMVKFLWLMEVQDPPMDLLWQDKGETVDKSRFLFYTARGTFVAQCVWPALLLHRDGPLMSKGVVQGDA